MKSKLISRGIIYPVSVNEETAILMATTPIPKWDSISRTKDLRGYAGTDPSSIEGGDFAFLNGVDIAYYVGITEEGENCIWAAIQSIELKKNGDQTNKYFVTIKQDIPDAKRPIPIAALYQHIEILNSRVKIDGQDGSVTVNGVNNSTVKIRTHVATAATSTSDEAFFSTIEITGSGSETRFSVKLTRENLKQALAGSSNVTIDEILLADLNPLSGDNSDTSYDIQTLINASLVNSAKAVTDAAQANTRIDNLEEKYVSC